MIAMDPESLQRVVVLAREAGTVFVATADHGGLPHITAAGPLSLLPEEGRVVFEAWFCPRMIANLEVNRWLAMVVWHTGKNVGYQLFGRAEEVEDVLLMDGFDPKLEAPRSIPQAKKRLTIRVDKLIGFRPDAHTDESL